jgi:hypothetical protein
LSEIAGSRSSGRSSLLSSALAAVTANGELAALVDTLDMFDVGSGANAGIRLGRLLWIRGDAISRHPSPAGVEAGFGRAGQAGRMSCARRSVGGERLAAADPWARALDRAIKAANLVLQAGGFDLVVLDLAEVLPEAIRRLPFTTWFRLQRTLEGSRTACLLVAPTPVARSSGGVTLALSREPGTAGSRQQATGSGQQAASSRQQPAVGIMPPAASPALGEAAQRPSRTGCQPPARWSGRPGEVRLLLGFDIEARVIRSREAAGSTCRFAVNT